MSRFRAKKEENRGKHIHPWRRRRLVSKSRYIAQIGGKILAALSGMVVILVGLIGNVNSNFPVA